MINQIEINGTIFKENCILKIKEECSRLRFIKIGNNRFTIELQSIDDPKKFKILGEQNNGKEEFSADFFFAELIG